MLIEAIANTLTATPLLRGVLLGLGAAVPIGPVNVEIARRVLRRGFLSGFALGCGAVTVDITYAVCSSLSFTRLLARPAVSQIIGAGGVILLAYLAVLCFRAAARAVRTDPIAVAPDAARASARSDYLTGLLMTLINPMTLAFWFTVVPGQVSRDGASAAGGLPLVCAGVFVGTIAWVVAFAGLLAWAGRWRRWWWLAAADGIGGTILLAFAVLGFLRLVRPFL